MKRVYECDTLMLGAQLPNPVRVGLARFSAGHHVTGLDIQSSGVRCATGALNWLRWYSPAFLPQAPPGGLRDGPKAGERATAKRISDW